jgi:hypothetical protein
MGVPVMIRTFVVLALVVGAAVSRGAAASCRDPSHVVGYHRCRRFGQYWAREDPAAFFGEELDFFAHTFAANELATARSSLPTSNDPGMTMAGMGFRFITSPIPRWYGGLELYGAATERAPSFAGDAESFGGNLVFGAHVIERFRTELSFELAAGAHTDRFYACAACTSPEATQTRGELLARARVDVFIHPAFSIAFTYGQGMLARDDHIAMLGFAGHASVLDGM